MNKLIEFLTNQNYSIDSFESENISHMYIRKCGLFLTVGFYYIRSISFSKETGFLLLLESEMDEKEYVFDHEDTLIDHLSRIIEHEEKTKAIFEKLEETIL